jgi:hypothetical protein
MMPPPCPYQEHLEKEEVYSCVPKHKEKHLIDKNVV